METTFLLIFITFVLGIGAWLLFLWAVRTDQFDDLEGSKHRMLDDGEEDRQRNIPPEKSNSPKQ
jgi:cbb3-type cytochrome oxidase maturation protein